MFLVDIGNSRLKWAIAGDDGLSAFGDFICQKSGLAGELDRIWKSLPQPHQVWISSVSDDVTGRQVEQWIEENWKCNPRHAEVSSAACGVINSYPDPARLGIDRWLALIATWNKYRSAACIIDCGTAVTVDGLDSYGKHVGGLILPGISVMQNSVFNATAIKSNRHADPDDVVTLANNTEEAVIAGCRMAVAGLAERVSRDMQEQYHEGICTILTGGDADTVGRLLKIEYRHEPHLVLEGLAVYAGEHT